MVLTSDMEWDPSSLDTNRDNELENNRRVSKIMRTDIGDGVYDNTHESILAQVSTIFDNAKLAKIIVSKVTVGSSYISNDARHKTKGMELRDGKQLGRHGAISIYSRHSDISPETLERNWDIGYLKAEVTLKCTT